MLYMKNTNDYFRLKLFTLYFNSKNLNKLKNDLVNSLEVYCKIKFSEDELLSYRNYVSESIISSYDPKFSYVLFFVGTKIYLNSIFDGKREHILSFDVIDQFINSSKFKNDPLNYTIDDFIENSLVIITNAFTMHYYNSFDCYVDDFYSDDEE